MNFDFSDDQKEFKAQVARFLGEQCPLTVARRVLDGEETHAAEIWKGLADLGALGVAVPEAYGGMGLGMLELCVIAEEVGRACAPVPFTSSVCLATEAIRRFGTDAQKGDASGGPPPAVVLVTTSTSASAAGKGPAGGPGLNWSRRSLSAQ